MTTHSPGPWLAYNSDNGRIFKHWRIKGQAVRNEPAFAVIDPEDKLAPEYAHANAKLIAAAPDLLAALEAFLDMPYPTVGQEMGYQTAQGIQRHRELARAAIAKATE